MHSCNEMENFQLMVFVNPLSIFLPATDVFLAASQKQESTSREERLSLPQEKEYKAKSVHSRCKRKSICYQLTTPHGVFRFYTVGSLAGFLRIQSE